MQNKLQHRRKKKGVEHLHLSRHKSVIVQERRKFEMACNIAILDSVSLKQLATRDNFNAQLVSFARVIESNFFPIIVIAG